jgi:hypothetical protein
MLDFRNKFLFGFLNIKYFLLILVLCLLGSINSTISLISLIFILIFGTSLITLELIKKLKSYKKSFTQIIEYSGVYVINSIIFCIFQLIVVVLFILFFQLISNTNILLFLDDPSIIFSNIFSFLMFFIIFIIFILILILEFLKIIGFIKYTKSRKFEDIFTIGKNLKLIFSNNFFICLQYLIGYIVIYSILFIIIIFIITSFFNNLSFYLTNMFLLFYIYLINCGFYSIIYEAVK